MRRRWGAAAIVAAIVCAAAPPLQAYLKLGMQVGDRLVSLQWDRFPVRYFVTNRAVPGVTPQQVQQAVSAAFATWDAVPSATLSSQFAGFTATGPLENTAQTVLGFEDEPSLRQVLGATSFTVDVTTGEILEADVFFNSTFQWSVAPAGEAGRYDLQSIALHEIGHLHGLGHSALGETDLHAGGRSVIASGAVMFPIAFSPGSIDERTLRADDIAGISDLYGTSAFKQTAGSIAGTVRKNGAGVFGAHIVAFNLKTGNLVGGFSLAPDGSFVIASLDPGTYVLRVEPLDDVDLDGFFDDAARVDVSFRPVVYDELIAVPRGGTATHVDVTVVPK
ncbi:MAG TPA: matrixin family metalloprotease [Vicinamibacterales bacterium]|nr:matrixin family metalloprotease [Vicinamibacterales bacterium]